MIRHTDKPATLAELSDRIDAGDDQAYVEAATLLWGEAAGAAMARARANVNALTENPIIREPETEYLGPTECDLRADGERASRMGWTR